MTHRAGRLPDGIGTGSPGSGVGEGDGLADPAGVALDYLD